MKILNMIKIPIAILLVFLIGLIAYNIWGYSDFYINSKSLPKPEVIYTINSTDESGLSSIKVEGKNCKIRYWIPSSNSNEVLDFQNKTTDFSQNVSPNGGEIKVMKGQKVEFYCIRYGNLPTVYQGLEPSVVTIN